ncbi:MAG: glycosyltransferase, partial [Nitrososphaeraceae archaeon]
MKKVLIIADLYHASPRIPSLSKYFPEFKWEPIVLTGHSPESEDQIFRVIQTPFPDSVVEWKKRLFLHPHDGFQKQIGIPLDIRNNNRSLTTMLINLLSSIITYPDQHKNWKHFALRSANELFEREKIDAVISSSSPVTSHLIASEIRKKWRVPWVADLRDLWSQNHNYRYGIARKFFDQRLELRILKTADAIVTVSPVWAENLKKLHNRTVFSITNGFDPDLLRTRQNILTNKFSITYTGPIYSGKHNTSEFLSSIKDLVENKVINPNDIEVRFYGPIDELMQKEIQQYQLTNIVKQYNLIPRKMSFEKQRESQLLLLLYWNDPNVKGWYPLKVFEYLASQRPILVTGGSGGDVVEKLINQTKAGAYCRNKMDIKERLTQFYIEYKEKGRINNHDINLDEINKYNYKNAARKFTEILENISDHTGDLNQEKSDTLEETY